jgi:hypothetical protein
MLWKIFKIKGWKNLKECVKKSLLLIRKREGNRYAALKNKDCPYTSSDGVCEDFYLSS